MDPISQLPDEILHYILSFLTFQEAARTSVLSKRWIDLWMSFARLDFDAPKLWEGLEEIDEYPPYNALLKSRRCHYIKWVNKVLQSHKALALDAFRIRFNLDKSSQNHVNKWLEYAFSRKVQTLDLILYDEFNLSCGEPYVFPHFLIGLGNENSSAVSLSGYQGDGINSNAFHGFKSLRALTLENVNVSGEVLEYFLHNCPFLENLTVRSSACLTHFKVCGSSLALKHLDLCYCHSLSLTVCDSNIVSLKTTRGHKLTLKNVPMLVDVFVAGWSSRKFVRGVTSWLSCCLSKLEVLTLQMRDCDVRLEKAMDVVLPQLTKLRQLTFALQASEDDSLMVFTSLIRASPNLEKFVLKLNWQDDIARIRSESEKALAFPLRHLKVVELLGYYGRRTEVELVEYLLENAIALERVTVDPRHQPFFGPNDELPEKEEITRNLAREQLRELVPSHVELEIL